MFDAVSLHSVLFVAVMSFVLIAACTEWLSGSRARRRLADRPTFTDDEFKRTFYSHDEHLAETAVRVRKALAENLDMPLDAVRPDDRLDDDLNARLESNPLFFASLDAELGISTGYEDLETFEKTRDRLLTFADLVEYAHGLVARATKDEQSDAQSAGILDRVLLFLEHLLPVACGVGLIIAIVGGILRIDAMWRFGSAVFILGVSAFGLSFLMLGVDTFTLDFRERGMTWVREQPIRASWLAVLIAAVVFMAMGVLIIVYRAFTEAL